MQDHFIPLEGVSGDISLELVTPDARGEYRVRLWTKQGRDPEDTGKGDFTGAGKLPPLLLGPASELRGRTVTWSLRFAPAANAGGAEYHAFIRILKDERDSLHTMEYSGPLEESNEIAGQFHFQPG